MLRQRYGFRRLHLIAAAAVLVAWVAAPATVRAAPPARQAAAPTYVQISGAGSSWSANAIDNWRRNIASKGVFVNYASTGSTDGRNQFRNATVDFGVSEIPYGQPDVFADSDTRPPRGFAYMPIVAGGTAFMYNLKIGGRRVTNLRLSGEVISKIFTGVIKRWDDPAIRADNPGLAMPGRNIVPVVRQDGSGTTAQFTRWMSRQYPAIWNAYCVKLGKPTPCGSTSNFRFRPNEGFVGQSGSTGVSGYVAQDNAEGAITYVEYSYAINARFPVVKLLNSAGYYTEPTAMNVAVALTQAKINQDERSIDYLTQVLDGVYRYDDPRTYPLSSYSYMIVPTREELNVTRAKGYTLATFAYYFLCEGQQQADVLGYSPLPKNLVDAGMDQATRIPGAGPRPAVSACNNPTFSRDGSNKLAKEAPQPSPCDRRGPTQNPAGTAGARQQTPVLAAARCGGGGPAAGGNAAGGGPGAPGATAPGAAGPGGTAAPTGAAVIDPDTGAAVAAPGGGSGGEQVAAVPVALAGERGWQLRHTIMLVAGLLLVGLVFGPPLLASVLNARREPGNDR